MRLDRVLGHAGPPWPTGCVGCKSPPTRMLPSAAAPARHAASTRLRDRWIGSAASHSLHEAPCPRTVAFRRLVRSSVGDGPLEGGRRTVGGRSSTQRSMTMQVPRRGPYAAVAVANAPGVVARAVWRRCGWTLGHALAPHARGDPPGRRRLPMGDPSRHPQPHLAPVRARGNLAPLSRGCKRTRRLLAGDGASECAMHRSPTPCSIRF